MPRLCVYRARPSLIARSRASRTTAGASKSGSPNSRWTTSMPARSSSCARSATSTARKGSISWILRASITDASQSVAGHARSAKASRPVPNDADLAPRLIGPGHGYLHNTTAGGPSPEEELDVEAKTSRSERLEQATGGRRRERFEAALRVGDAFETPRATSQLNTRPAETRWRRAVRPLAGVPLKPEDPDRRR